MIIIICTFLILFFCSDLFREILAEMLSWISRTFAYRNLGPIFVSAMFCAVILFGIIGALARHR